MTAAAASIPVAGTDRRLLARLAVMLCLAFFFIDEHRLGAWTLEADMEGAETVDEGVREVESGSPWRRLGFLLLAGTGIVCGRTGNASRKDPSRTGSATGWDTARRALPWMLAGLAGWCAASLLWSQDTSMTLRRLVALACFAVGVWGISRRVTPRDLAWLVVAIAGTYLVLGLVAELRCGTLRPWRSDFRLAGTQHPNGYAALCAGLCLAAVSLLGDARRGRVGLWIAAIAGVLLLLATRSRTSALALIAALLAWWLLRRRQAPRPGTLALAAGVLFAAAWVTQLLQIDLQRPVARLALMGRSEAAESLTGRTPLWEAVIDYIQQRPVLGYGYGAFWNAERIEAISRQCGWQITVAHSLYLELAAAVGVPAVVVLTGLLLAGLTLAGLQYVRLRRPGWDFVFAMLVFALCNGLTEAMFVDVRCMAFVNFCGLALALSAGRAAQRVPLPPRDGHSPALPAQPPAIAAA